jgi:hypothetical protein
MTTQPGGTSEENAMTVAEATALHFSTAEHDNIGDAVDIVLCNVQAFVPTATKPDLLEYLRACAAKNLLRVKPDEFVHVNLAGQQHFRAIAAAL